MLLIWIPREEVQVTESLLKQAEEKKDLFGFLLLEREEKKENQEINRVCSPLSATGLFCDASE